MRTELKEIKHELSRQLHRISRVAGERLPTPVKRHSRQIITVVGGITATIFLATVIGIYVLGWQNPLSLAVTRVLPLPAGFVAGRAINYHEYATRARSILPQGKSANQQAFGELVNNALVFRLAKQAGISVSGDEVERQLQLDMNVQGGEKAALAEAKRTYGTGRKGYAKRIEVSLLKLELEEWLQQSADNQQLAKDKASDVLEQAKQGTAFDDLVRRYSQSPGNTIQDQPGRMAVSGLPTEARTAVLAVKPDEIVDRPVLSGGTYFITKRLPDASEAFAQVIEIRVRNLSEWLSDELSTQKPIKLLPQLR